MKMVGGDKFSNAQSNTLKEEINMKKIDLNKSFTLEFDNNCPTCNTSLAKKFTKEITYMGTVEDALEYVPQGGLSFKEMAVRLAIKEKIKKGGTISLDDADVDKILDLVNNMAFRVLNKGYVEFYNYIKSIKESKGK